MIARSSKTASVTWVTKQHVYPHNRNTSNESPEPKYHMESNLKRLKYFILPPQLTEMW